MRAENFDNSFRDAFEAEQLPSNAALWARIEAQLPEDSPRAIPFWRRRPLALAASLALLIGSTACAYFLLRDTNTEPPHKMHAAAVKVGPSKPEALFNQPPEPVTDKDITLKETAPPAYYPVLKRPPVLQSTSSGNIAAALPQAIKEEPVTAYTRAAAAQQEKALSPGGGLQDNNAEVAGVQPNAKVAAEMLSAKIAATGENPQSFQAPKKSSMLFSVNGGYNYGVNQQQGYALGMSARKKLSAKMYVEGGLAFVSSNIGSNNEVRQFNAARSASNSFVTMSAAAPEGILTTARYVSVKPSVGYNITKKVSLSVGADVQRMIASGAQRVVVDGGIKNLPLTDLGMAGQGEYRITPKIKAGLIYRQALNNSLMPGNDYLDRSYLQLNMSYNINR